MKKNRIFLSYRRDDSPGYVSRLESELEQVFGTGRVFRDTADIPGGTKWKNVIDENLHRSAALILIIGPRWEQIWRERIDDKVNYVALELQRAHELDVPIIPLTLDGTQLSKGFDLGSINFVYDNQFHDISDRQGRWQGDFNRLVKLLESAPGMGSGSAGNDSPAQSKKSGGKSIYKWLAAACLFIAVAAWIGMGDGVDEPGYGPIRPEPDNPSPSISSAPNISGTWQGNDGTIYFVRQSDDGAFTIESPGYGSGRGDFIPNMPGKFRFEMFGIGQGEFAVSTTGNKAMGWIIIDGQQQFDTLIRIE